MVVEPEFSDEAFSGVLRDAECAVYVIGLPEQFAFDTAVFDRVNRGLLNTFLFALKASPVRRLVYISTFEVFASHDGVIPGEPSGPPHWKAYRPTSAR